MAAMAADFDFAIVVACRDHLEGSVAGGRIAMAFIEPGLADIYYCELRLLGLQATSAVEVQSLLGCRYWQSGAGLRLAH